MAIHRVLMTIGAGVLAGVLHRAANFRVRVEHELDLAWTNRHLPRTTFVVLVRVDCPCSKSECPGYDIFKAPVQARTSEEAAWIVDYYMPGWTALTKEEADELLTKQEKLEAQTASSAPRPERPEDGTLVTFRFVGILPPGTILRRHGGGEPEGNGGMTN